LTSYPVATRAFVLALQSHMVNRVHGVVALCLLSFSSVQAHPNPGALEKIVAGLICFELENTAKEEEITKEICQRVNEKMPSIPEELCQEAAKKVWEIPEKKCEEYDPMKLIRDLVCKELEKGTEENKIVDKVCTTVHNQFESIPNGVCKFAVKAAWEDKEKQCPKVGAAQDPSLPKAMHDYLCKELAKNANEEDAKKATAETFCEPYGLNDALCWLIVDKAWKDAQQTCPKPQELAKPSPLPEPMIPPAVQKLIHDLLCKMLENQSVEDAFEKKNLWHGAPG